MWTFTGCMLLRNYLCPGYAACFLTLGIFVPRNFDMHQERMKKASGDRHKVLCMHLLSLLCATGAAGLRTLLTDKPAENSISQHTRMNYPGSCINSSLIAGFTARFTGWNEYFVLILECTAGEVLAKSCRSAVPGAKLPRPVHAPHLHPCRRRRSYSKIFCNDWVTCPTALSQRAVFPVPTDAWNHHKA